MTDIRLSLKESSVYTSVSEETLRYWRSVDEGPASFKLGRRVFYRKSELDRWLAEQEQETRRGGIAS